MLTKTKVWIISIVCMQKLEFLDFVWNFGKKKVEERTEVTRKEPRSQSPQHRTQSPESRAQSSDLRAQSPEPRAQSTEPRAQRP